MNLPRISVLMSVYNGESTLAAAIDSILRQTFADFEFVIIDDGSTDGSVKILEDFAASDSRIRVHRQDNTGLTVALNHGLRLCRADLIARQDADDRSLPDRLERQLEFMDKHLDIAFLGTNGHLLGKSGQRYATTSKPAMDQDIRKRMRKHNQFIHSSVLMRKDAVQSIGGYDETFRTSQDYEMWLRLLDSFPAANLAEPLVEVYQGANRISKRHARQQQKAGLRAKWKHRNGAVLKGAPWYLFWWQLRGLIIPPGTLDALRARRS